MLRLKQRTSILIKFETGIVITELIFPAGKTKLTPPCFLAGQNASQWCLKNGFFPSQSLITKESAQLFTRASKMRFQPSPGTAEGEAEVLEHGGSCISNAESHVSNLKICELFPHLTSYKHSRVKNIE